MFLCPNTDLSVKVQTAARVPLCLLQVGGFLNKKTRFSDRRAFAVVRVNRWSKSTGRNSHTCGWVQQRDFLKRDKYDTNKCWTFIREYRAFNKVQQISLSCVRPSLVYDALFVHLVQLAQSDVSTPTLFQLFVVTLPNYIPRNSTNTDGADLKYNITYEQNIPIMMLLCNLFTKD